MTMMVKAVLEEYDGIHEVKPILVLDTPASKYFDIQRDQITIGETVFSLASHDTVYEEDDDTAEQYPEGFWAWYVSAYRDEISVHAAYFIERKKREEAGDDGSAFDTVDTIIDIPEGQAAETKTALERKYGNENNLEDDVQAAVLEKAIRLNIDRKPDPERDARLLGALLRKYFPGMLAENRKKVYRAYTGEAWSEDGSYETLKSLPPARLFALWSAAALDPYNVPDFLKLKRLEAKDFEINLFLAFTGLSLEGFKSLYQETLDELVQKACADADDSDEDSEDSDEEDDEEEEEEDDEDLDEDNEDSDESDEDDEDLDFDEDDEE